MNDSDSRPPRPFRPLRAWPAALLVALGLITRIAPNHLEGGMSSYWLLGLIGPLACGALLLLWWLIFSRATWRERVWGSVGLLASLGAIIALSDPTMRGPGTIQITFPMGMAAFALGAVALAARPPKTRTAFSLLLAVAGFAFSLLLRNEGATGEYWLDTRWRWSRSAEESLLASRPAATPAGTERSVAATATTTATTTATNGGPSVSASGFDRAALDRAEWPGFRGRDRAARVRGVTVSTNWTARPPRPLWKISVGPAWSSFAVAGPFLFTQEQRGPMEAVVCYEAATGREVWIQLAEGRLEDPLGGPGPRATPSVSKDGVFALGPTGLLHCLNPATGAVIWKQDLRQLAGRAAPMWGFSGSPVVSGSMVIVHAGGPGNKGVLALDVLTGALRWSAPAGNDSYSSPQLNTIAGVESLLMLSNDGLVFLDPATGRERLDYAWKFSNYRALQPHVLADDTVLLPTSMTTGTRAIQVTRAEGRLAAKELWTTRILKPDYTDLVSHQGHIYALDGGFLVCLDAKTGERKWKGGRYGKGQVLLLEDAGLLLVLSEQGQVVLVRADPGAHAELATFQALQGKTWNHPVVVGDRLYVRNAEQAAAYVLPRAE